MHKETRIKYDQYAAQVAQLNGVASVTQQFNVAPSVQQKMENTMQESTGFLQRINVFGVREMKGEKILVGVNGPVASNTDTTVKEREPSNVAALDANDYECKKNNSDTFIPYSLLDAWAGHPEFQKLLRNAIMTRQALDRIMIGFNGVKYEKTTDRDANPLLQDVNIGWLQQIRDNRPENNMTDGKVSGEVSIGKGGDYANLDALVFDLVNNAIDPWYQENPDLVVICGRKLMADKYFPLINNDQPSTENLAAQIIMSQKRVGNLPAYKVPYVPPNTLLVTTFKNLSLYWQIEARRRTLIDNPKRDRIENYESSNDAYVLEDYGLAAMAENIKILSDDDSAESEDD